MLAQRIGCGEMLRDNQIQVETYNTAMSQKDTGDTMLGECGSQYLVGGAGDDVDLTVDKADPHHAITEAHRQLLVLVLPRQAAHVHCRHNHRSGPI